MAWNGDVKDEGREGGHSCPCPNGTEWIAQKRVFAIQKVFWGISDNRAKC